MKLGIVFVIIGIASLLALAIFLAMNLIMGNYGSAFWMTVYTGIVGGISLYSGIKRIRKARNE